MSAWKSTWWLPAVAGLAFLPLHVPSALSADQNNQQAIGKAAPQQAVKAPVRFDRGKADVIEPAVKNIVRNTAPASTPAPAAPDPRLDVVKRTVIERRVAGVVGPPAPPPVAPAPAAKPRIDIGKTLVIEPAVKDLVKSSIPVNSPPVNFEPAVKEVIKRTEKDLGQAPTAPAKNEGLDVTKTGVYSNPQLVNGPPPSAISPPPAVDVGKYTVIEPAVRNAVTPNGGIAIPRPRLDVGKGAVIEPRVKDIVRGVAIPPTPPMPSPLPPAVTEPAPAPKGFVNPKVEAGKVKWHATLEEACAASKKSRKPVMLFQMMGKLDDHFC